MHDISPHWRDKIVFQFLNGFSQTVRVEVIEHFYLESFNSLTDSHKALEEEKEKGRGITFNSLTDSHDCKSLYIAVKNFNFQFLNGFSL